MSISDGETPASHTSASSVVNHGLRRLHRLCAPFHFFRGNIFDVRRDIPAESERIFHACLLYTSPGLIAVFMSGYAESFVLRKVMHNKMAQGGMTNYIQKPFTINILLSRVAAALRTRAEASQATLSFSAR